MRSLLALPLLALTAAEAFVAPLLALQQRSAVVGGGFVAARRNNGLPLPRRASPTLQEEDVTSGGVDSAAASSASGRGGESAADRSPSPCPSCFPTDAPWRVHKFGGASLATADLYRTVGDLLLEESSPSSTAAAADGDGGPAKGRIPTLAVVSARGGMTDLLVRVVDSALTDFGAACTALQEAVDGQVAVLERLAPPPVAGPVADAIRSDAGDVRSVVQSLRLLRTVPAVTMEVVTGFGEIWSARTLWAYLVAGGSGASVEWLDARDVLVVRSASTAAEGLGEKGAASSTGGVTVEWTRTAHNMARWWSGLEQKPDVVIVTGFVARTAGGVPTTLKRSGSDYSATIFAKLVAADRVTMWKNTDGVYTADPRAVPEAFPIASLKYDEAMELAYFGAQVLHPSAMVPVIEQQIPVYVRNIFNPAFEGTVITGRSPTLVQAMGESVRNWRAKSGEIPIKGITSVDKTALVTLEGASTGAGGAVVAERCLKAMADGGINVLIITQASSESSITFAVPESEGRSAVRALEAAFELELSRSTIGSVSLATGMSIVAIVGEGMARTSGVSSTFMSSLARANVNIHLIAQGSSERQIAVVVRQSDASRALRAAHMAFTLSETVASVALLGARGSVGTALCHQIKAQKESLAKNLGVGVSINIAACSKTMAVCKDSRGLDLDQLAAMLDDEKAATFDLDEITAALKADVSPLRVVVDCTNSDDVGDYYERWLSMGVSIITPGRRVGAGDLDRYHRVCKAQKENSVNLYLESSVGNALPIISTLDDLVETGDTIKSIEGALSGTMAFVLSTFSEDLPFSEAVRNAANMEIPEKDLRVDLSGLDTAQKLVILAREAGLDVSLEDVEVEDIVPEEIQFKFYENNDQLLEDVKQLMDGPMLERQKAAEESGRRLRYKFKIDLETKKCRCWLDEVTETDPLFRLKRNENLVAFETARYETSPLLVKGASAGPDLAAAGIFADLLRLTRAYSSNQG